MRVIFVVVVWALAAAGCEKTQRAGEAAGKPSATAQAATPAVPPTTPPDDEAGEPMDDVDEEEPPSEKSGVGEPSEAEGDGPEGEKLDMED